VFFDDILIYNRTWEEHLKHVDEILTIMEEQTLFSKEEKCEFGLTEILYIGHAIDVEGVKVHQEKIQTIFEWSTPRTVTDLRGFFRICSYYRCFVKGFSQLVAPLTNLAKKGAFTKMKRVMSTFPVLTLPYFTHPFSWSVTHLVKG
jgi:hypothetical protein